MSAVSQVYELEITGASDKTLNGLSDVFAFYDSINKGLRQDLAKSKILAQLRIENETKLKAQLEEQAYLLATYADEAPIDPVVVEAEFTSFERCQLLTKVERAELELKRTHSLVIEKDGLLSAAAQELYQRDINTQILMDRISALTTDVRESDLSFQELTRMFNSQVELFKDQVANNIELMTQAEINKDKLALLEKQASLLVAAKEERKKALDNSNNLSKSLAVANRRIEVLEKEAAKFKLHRKQGSDAVEAARRALSDTTLRFDELSNELVRERMERRYLTMMIDSLNNSDFFETKNGMLSLHSFEPLSMVSVHDENSNIDPAYPLGLWTNHNGTCCIVAVSKESNEDGDRDLIMPKVDGLSIKGHKLLCPNKTDTNLIVKELMKYDAVACNEAIERCRFINSHIAQITNSDENRILTNKRLAALSKYVTPAGVSVLPKRTTATKKRKVSKR